MIVPKKQRVMGTERTVVDGITFASKREARRYGELKLLERAGQITELKLQAPIELLGRNHPVMTDGGKVMTYRADFTYYDIILKAVVIEDAKGYPTDTYKMKRAILKAMGVEIREV